MTIESSDVAVVGHFTIDSIRLPYRSSPFIVLGGAATYVSLAVKRLDGTVSVVSKVGNDFPEAYLWWLKQEGIDLSGVTKLPNELTTRFELEYNQDFSNRDLRSKNQASAIGLNDLSSSLRARAIHLAPVACEISYEVAERLKNCSQFLSLDPQGLLRSFDDAGNVACNSLFDKRILGLVNIYKSSEDEIKASTGQSDINSAIKAIHDFGVEMVIVTLGAKGVILSIEGETYKVPSYKPVFVADPTGAGDVFIGSFLAKYVNGEDLLWCACVGSAAASLIVESIGPTFFGEKQEIYKRANEIYEKGIKH